MRVVKLTVGGGYVRSLCMLCIVYGGVTDAELHTVHCAKCRALLSGLLAAAARSEDCAVAACRRISSLDPI